VSGRDEIVIIIIIIIIINTWVIVTLSRLRLQWWLLQYWNARYT